MALPLGLGGIGQTVKTLVEQHAQQGKKISPQFQQQLNTYIQKNSNNKGLGNILSHNPNAVKELSGGAKLPKPHQWAEQEVGHLIKRMTATSVNGGKPLSEADARKALMQELLQPQNKTQAANEKLYGGKPDKNIHFSQTFQNPVDAALGGKGTFKLSDKVKDPFLTLKNAKDKKQAFATLTAASIERSPMGQIALTASDPKIQVGAFKEQYSQHVMDSYNTVASPGGLADQYDAYLSAKSRAAGMTAAQKRAAGLDNLTDPLTVMGLGGQSGRTWLGLDPGQPLDGTTIKAAAANKLQAERASIQSGVPQPGSQLGDVLKQLSLTPSGKQLANIFTNLALPPELQSVFGLEEEIQSNYQNENAGKSLQDILNATGSTTAYAKAHGGGATAGTPSPVAPGLK